MSVSAADPAAAPAAAPASSASSPTQLLAEQAAAPRRWRLEAVKARLQPRVEAVRSRVLPAVEAVKARVQPAVEAVQSRLHPTVTSVRSFSRLLNDFVRPEVQDKDPDSPNQPHDWFDAYDCCRSTKCCAAFKCCEPYANRTALSVVLLIFVGIIISLVSLIEVSGHAPGFLRSNSTQGGGGGGDGGGGWTGGDGGDGGESGGENGGGGGGGGYGGGGGGIPGSTYNNLGICYGRLGNNLPSSAEVVSMLQSLEVGMVRIYDVDSGVFEAFANTQIKVLACVPNAEMKSLASGSGVAKTWLQKHIVPYSDTKITAISVGNEVLLATPDLASYLVPALTNLHTALMSLGLDSKIKLSSAMALNVLANSYPPSSGEFKSAFATNVMKPFLDFLANTDSFFMLNVYPYFAYRDNLNVISFEYAAFKPNPGIRDSTTGLQYSNLLDAQMDAVISAMGALGHKSDIPLVVTETGWPSKGDADEAGASKDNAREYNNNLVSHVLSGNGTPLRPGIAITAYIFALFNENSKPGATSERNFGLFWPSKEKVYNISLPQGGTEDGNQSGDRPPDRNARSLEQTWIHSLRSLGRRSKVQA